MYAGIIYVTNNKTQVCLSPLLAVQWCGGRWERGGVKEGESGREKVWAAEGPQAIVHKT